MPFDKRASFKKCVLCGVMFTCKEVSKLCELSETCICNKCMPVTRCEAHISKWKQKV